MTDDISHVSKSVLICCISLCPLIFMSVLHMEIGGHRIRFLRSLMSGMTLLAGTGAGTHNPSSLNLSLSSSSTTSRDLLPQFPTCSECGLKKKENYHVLVNQFLGNFRSKTPSCRKIRSVFRDLKLCFNPSTAKLFNLDFHPLEAVSHWRDPQLQHV